MLRLYIPAAVTLVLLASLTAWEAKYSDRWTDTNISAEEFGRRFANLPKQVGPWQGTDGQVHDETLEVAGAVNHVSRTYENSETGARVDLWLVVGHARDIGRHTPDVCYPSQGFAQDGDKLKQRIEASGEAPATFFTARFRNEAAVSTQRVFWAWNANESADDQWEAPDNSRIRFGNNRALYKMYFTASMQDRNQPITDNVAYDFAELMLPVVNRTLFPERYGIAPGDVAEAAQDAVAEAPASDEDAGLDESAVLDEAATAEDETSTATPPIEATPADDAP